MAASIKKFFLISFISIIPTILVWLPFFFRVEKFWGIPLPRNGMATIVANYDGPFFIAVAKTFYDTASIKESFSFGLPVEYFAAHFPLFPILIRLFAMAIGYPYSMLFVTVASSILALYFFNKFISDYTEKGNAIWVTIVFAILPARWLIVRSVGSAEPLFLAGILASVYYFKQKKYLLAGIWGIVAQLTKSPGILLFISYILAIFVPEFKKFATQKFSNYLRQIKIHRMIPLFLIPISLFGVFWFFAQKFGDFYAYFHSGDNIHLFFPPFQIFNYSAPWVGTFWLEEVILVYLFGLIGLTKLVKMKEYSLAWFTGVFFVSILFVSHRDLIRYSLPIVPFIFAAFADSIAKREFKIVMAVLAVPIYLFTLSYISQNVMPISDWAPFL